MVHKNLRQQEKVIAGKRRELHLLLQAKETKSCSSKCCQNKCEKCGINEDDCHCGKRSSEARLKTEAYRKSMQEWSINKSCDFSNCTAQLKGQCLSRVTLYECIDAMEDFWGPVTATADQTSIRCKKKIVTGELTADPTSVRKKRIATGEPAESKPTRLSLNFLHPKPNFE